MFTSPFQNQTLYIMHTQHVYWINKHQYLKSFPGLNMIIGSSNFNNQAPQNSLLIFCLWATLGTGKNSPSFYLPLSFKPSSVSKSQWFYLLNNIDPWSFHPHVNAVAQVSSFCHSLPTGCPYYKLLPLSPPSIVSSGCISTTRSVHLTPRQSLLTACLLWSCIFKA